MTLNSNGRFDPDTKEVILDSLMTKAKTRFGNDLNDNQYAVIRFFYEPIAEELAAAQVDISKVLDSAQIDHAEGEALDLLTEQIGVSRLIAKKATGTVTFSRANAAGADYEIASGTRVQTDGSDPVEFKTTETVTLLEGNTEVDASVEAVTGGSDGNLGASTLTVMPDPPTGIESVTNDSDTNNGKNEESDEDLRDRAKAALANGSAATANALLSAVTALEDSRAVSIFINDNGPDSDTNLPLHAFEMVVEGPQNSTFRDEVAEAIGTTKSIGDISHSGENGAGASGTYDMVNGQTWTIEFSEPTAITIYVDVTLDKEPDDYVGDNAVMDAVVEYIGGVTTGQNAEDGDLTGGEDVFYNEILAAIITVPGVVDVTDLQVATSDPPSGTANIAISNTEVATTDADAGDIGVTSNDV